MSSTVARAMILAFSLSAIAGCSTTGQRRDAADMDCNKLETPSTVCASETTGSIKPAAGNYAFEHAEFGPTLNTPEVFAALARRDAASEEVAKANAMIMPRVNLEAQAGGLSERDSGYSYGSSGNAYSYGLSVEVPIYQGGRAEAAMKVARADHAAASEQAKDVVLSTTYSILLSQALVERQKAAIAAYDRQEKQLKRLRNSIDTEVAAGAASRVDLNDINRQLARLSVNRQQARIQLAGAKQTLMRYSAPQNLIQESALAARMPKSEAELIATALSNNPRIGERLARMDGAAARVDGAKAAYNPNLSLLLGVRGEESSTYGGSRDHNGSVVVRFSVPLYTGGLRSADIRQKQEEERAAIFERDAAVNGVTAAVRAAIDRRARAAEMLRLANTEKRNAVAALEGVKKERALGERTVFDEIRLNEDITNADINLASARYESRAADYTLAAEIGLLDDLAGSEVSLRKTARSVY
jgi:outer membrane protein